MNNILKQILLVAKDVATESVGRVIPGSQLVVSGIQKLLDKEDENNSSAINELEMGVLSVLNDLKPELIRDDVAFAEGIVELEKAFKKVKNSIK